MKLYVQNADYRALTEDERAMVCPAVLVSLQRDMVLRGRLTGKVMKPEGGASISMDVTIGPLAWLASQAYAVGDYVVSDWHKVYRCTAAGTSDDTSGPVGTGADITDGTVTWDYVGRADPVLQTYDVTLDELAQTDSPWSLDFEITIRESRKHGEVYPVWAATAVATGLLRFAAVERTLSLPTTSPYAALVDMAVPGYMQIHYTPDRDTMSLTCMTYVLEAL